MAAILPLGDDYIFLVSGKRSTNQLWGIAVAVH